MIKKIGFTIMGVLFLGIYISLALTLFSGSEQSIHYAKDEFMFGSYTLLGGFIFMTIILLLVCNYLIDLFFNKNEEL